MRSSHQSPTLYEESHPARHWVASTPCLWHLLLFPSAAGFDLDIKTEHNKIRLDLQLYRDVTKPNSAVLKKIGSVAFV